MSALSTRDALAAHSIAGAQTPPQGAGQTTPELMVLCFTCGWMRASEYPGHLIASGAVVDANTLAGQLCPLDPNEPHGCSTLVAVHDLARIAGLTERGA